MKVPLVFQPGCPNAEPARAALDRALASVGLSAEIEKVQAYGPTSPDSLRRWGSPTILIDGVDVAGGRPTGPACRVYEEGGATRGVPPDATIRGALERARGDRHRWFRSLAPVPGAALALLPSATCPACVAGYAGVLSAAGLGFLFDDRILAPVVGALLVVGVASVAYSTRSHRNPGPLAATLVGAGAVAAGRLLWNLPILLYAGVALLLGASLWNLWLKRRQPAPLLQVRSIHSGPLS